MRMEIYLLVISLMATYREKENSNGATQDTAIEERSTEDSSTATDSVIWATKDC